MIDRARLITFVSCLLAFALSCQGQQGNYSNAAIEKLNLKFRELYASARTERLTDISPIIIARGDSLVLLRDDQRIEGTRVSANYHDLKTIAHVPLAVFCVLDGHCEKKLSENIKLNLNQLSHLMSASKVRECFDTPMMRDRQASMIRRCTSFIEVVLKTQSCSKQQLAKFIDEARPAILKNVDYATRLRIDNYHRQMMDWRAELTKEEWERLYVIIPGASMSRKNSTAVQYFAKLLQERGEGRRIIYAESQYDESQDLMLLGTHILDSQVGVAFFGDPWRMQRDLLASAADSYLDSLDFENEEHLEAN